MRLVSCVKDSQDTLSQPHLDIANEPSHDAHIYL
jgi:hypothetical protein